MSVIIEPIVSFVIERIANLLYEEVKFLGGVEDQVNGLLKELTWMQSYLRDAEARQEEFDEIDRIRFREITRVAYDAEDVVESFILEPATMMKRNATTMKRKERFLRKYILICCSSLHTHQVGTEVEAIKKRIQETAEMFQRCHIRNRLEHQGQSSTSMVPQVRSYPYTTRTDEHVVGLDEDIKRSVEKLTTDSTFDILAIVGMGGSGKTTLARKIYNHESIKRHFRCMAWVSVSQEWNAQYILSEIFRQVGKEEEGLSVESWRTGRLIEELHCFLQDKVNLIVLDDVWQKEALMQMLPAFPLRNGAGSKIIVTTRNEDVVHLTDLRCTIHKPRMLNEGQSWELFSKVAFPNGKFPNFDEFEVLGKEMVKKCQGLPLAVISLGGLSSRKGSLDEWEDVKAAVSSKIMASGSGSHLYQGVRDILELSYGDLPCQLKPCFLYLGLFPKDTEIPVSMLMRMWIAEGFIACDTGSSVTLENMARNYLEELIQRCMIQVVKINHENVVKTCGIHDLMRDLCITKGKELEFLEVFSTNANSTQATPTESRQLAIYLREDHTLPLTQNSHVRSLQLYGHSAPKSVVVKELASALEKCKFLRVLHLWNIQVADDKKALPEEIGQLVFLRYLEIRQCGIYEIPQSISNLCRLLSFFYGVNESDVEIRIPHNAFSKMERLVHLRLPFQNPIKVLTTGATDATNSEEPTKIELHALKSLRTLSGISSKSFMAVTDLEQLGHLRKLKISIASAVELEAVWQCPSIRMDRLFKLNLQCGDDVQVQSLEPLSHCRRLTKLSLRGRLITSSSLPLVLPRNLTKLSLEKSQFSQDPIPVLGDLLHLKWLKMCDAHEGTRMTCRGNAFPQLEVLFLYNMRDLERILVGAGAMPQLKQLYLVGCKKLEAVLFPRQIEVLPGSVYGLPVSNATVLRFSPFGDNDIRYCLLSFEHDLSSYSIADIRGANSEGVLECLML